MRSKWTTANKILANSLRLPRTEPTMPISIRLWIRHRLLDRSTPLSSLWTPANTASSSNMLMPMEASSGLTPKTRTLTSVSKAKCGPAKRLVGCSESSASPSQHLPLLEHKSTAHTSKPFSRTEMNRQRKRFSLLYQVHESLLVQPAARRVQARADLLHLQARAARHPLLNRHQLKQC